MKCPECENNFGYLLVDNLDKKGKFHEFDCPKCNARLSSEPLVLFLKKADVYIGVSVLLSFILVAIAVVFGESLITNIMVVLLVPSAICCIYVGVKIHKNSDNVYCKTIRKIL